MLLGMGFWNVLEVGNLSGIVGAFKGKCMVGAGQGAEIDVV